MVATDTKSTRSGDKGEWRAARLMELERKMRDELPESLAQLQRLTQTVVLEPLELRHRQQLEFHAHRLRGRAASLQLAALCAAAAALEQLSATSASPAELSAALADCDSALLELTAP